MSTSPGTAERKGASRSGTAPRGGRNRTGPRRHRADHRLGQREGGSGGTDRIRHGAPRELQGRARGARRHRPHLARQRRAVRRLARGCRHRHRRPRAIARGDGDDSGAVRSGVEDAQGELDHADAVSDGVVPAEQHRAPAVEAVHEDGAPERLAPVERRGALGGDQRLQLGVTAGLGKEHPVVAGRQVGVGLLLPVPRTVLAADHHAAEDGVAIPQPLPRGVEVARPSRWASRSRRGCRPPSGCPACPSPATGRPAPPTAAVQP